jgi:hypothetical protein
MPDGDEALDRPGNWEIRATLYRNGKRVGTCATTGHKMIRDRVPLLSGQA